jgi:maltoporin
VRYTIARRLPAGVYAREAKHLSDRKRAIRPEGAVQLVGLWQELDNGLPSGNRLTWLSLGARPGYHLSRYFSLELEAGLDHTRQSDGVSGSLMKLTLAPQITPGIAALSRPSLRAFVTYARWSDDFVGLVAPVLYGAENRGFAAGVQIETWW